MQITLTQYILQILNDFNNISVTFRLVLAVLMGGVIGLERGVKGRAAGMRTYMLVCLGACMVMITSQYLTYMFDIYLDPSRMGAQVISGIGFLGAGTIIITKDRQIRGLTTAAGLWASACMGLAIGVGFYFGAFVGMGLIVFVTSIMHNLDSLLVSHSRSIDIYIELDELASIKLFLADIRAAGTKVTYMEVVPPKYDNENSVALLLSLLMPTRAAHAEVLANFESREHVKFVEEV